ncbi:unnamed protein product [Vitrella brassicaformis CCMP3155]|uniref:Protein kinase domain-containing protein n=1 Tax=Vitrella brassicaformis (strain CCMP3155) TaxID=1169540 RepID=A0A0G4G1L6_VITBC|nr:unnamed protein product [Vitrella brassicaformis CCMP3155]|eukprot:CEM21926.1 unnamed protein product [Vitrella brassicaformis CCMP3155]
MWPAATSSKPLSPSTAHHAPVFSVSSACIFSGRIATVREGRKRQQHQRKRLWSSSSNKQVTAAADTAMAASDSRTLLHSGDGQEYELHEKLGGGTYATTYAGMWNGRSAAFKTLLLPTVADGKGERLIAATIERSRLESLRESVSEADLTPIEGAIRPYSRGRDRREPPGCARRQRHAGVTAGGIDLSVRWLTRGLWHLTRCHRSLLSLGVICPDNFLKDMFLHKKELSKNELPPPSPAHTTPSDDLLLPSIGAIMIDLASSVRATHNLPSRLQCEPVTATSKMRPPARIQSPCAADPLLLSQQVAEQQTPNGTPAALDEVTALVLARAWQEEGSSPGSMTEGEQKALWDALARAERRMRGAGDGRVFECDGGGESVWMDEQTAVDGIGQLILRLLRSDTIVPMVVPPTRGNATAEDDARIVEGMCARAALDGLETFHKTTNPHTGLPHQPPSAHAVPSLLDRINSEPHLTWVKGVAAWPANLARHACHPDLSGRRITLADIERSLYALHEHFLKENFVVQASVWEAEATADQVMDLATTVADEQGCVPFVSLFRGAAFRQPPQPPVTATPVAATAAAAAAAGSQVDTDSAPPARSLPDAPPAAVPGRTPLATPPAELESPGRAPLAPPPAAELGGGTYATTYAGMWNGRSAAFKTLLLPTVADGKGERDNSIIAATIERSCLENLCESVGEADLTPIEDRPTRARPHSRSPD